MATSKVAFSDKRRILRFPENLVESNVDEAGKPVPFVLFEISTSSSGSMMGGDYAVPPIDEKITPISESRLSFSSDLKTVRPWSIMNKLVAIDKAIALPMPNEHVVSTAVDYNQRFSPSNLQKVADFATSNASLGDKAMTVATSAASGIISGVLNKFANEAVKADATSQSQLEAAMLGRAVNPRHEVMFEGFDFRSFTFTYTFAPKSAAESEQLRELIGTFRYYALPEITPDRVHYTFPGVFRIQFFLGEKQNEWIPKIATSVLKRVNVNYSPYGTGWAILPQGDPLAVRISLEFTEIELIDRNRVDNTGTPDADPTRAGF